MSSSQVLTNLLVEPIESSQSLYFFRELPFFSTSLDFSAAYRTVPAPRPSLFIQLLANTTFRSPEVISPSTPEHLSSESSDSTLSPTLPPLIPIDPFESLFLVSFDNLKINPARREEVQRRLDYTSDLLRKVTRELIEERDQAIHALEALTADALITVRRRLLPEIKRLRNWLNTID